MAFIAAGTTVTATAQTTGSWTPTATGNGFSSATGRYFKIGKLVYVVGRWVIPTGNTSSAGSGLGAQSTSQFKISGLPFTAANTSNPVLNALGSHCAVNGNKQSGVSVVVYHNTTEMRFFGGIVLYNSSYGSFSGEAGGPSTGSEMSVGNACVPTNDDDKNKGGCSFFYYTD